MNDIQQQETEFSAEQTAFFNREGIYFIALGGAEEVGLICMPILLTARLLLSMPDMVF